MKINILGIDIDSLTFEQSLAKIEFFLDNKKQQQLITANPEIILAAWQDSKYQNLINNSSLVVADGIGLLWAAKFLSLKSNNFLASLAQLIVTGISLILQPAYCRSVLPERIAGVDLMEKICQLAAKKNKKVFLLGGRPGIAGQAAEVLQKKYHQLRIVGAEAGPNKLEANFGSNIDLIIDKIKQVEPDILFVAFGSPKQDYFIKNNLAKTPSIKLAMGVGGSFDFISGRTKRAPEVYRDLGLEWLYRFIRQPWRAIRIFNATIRFSCNVIRFKHLLNKKQVSADH